MGKIYTKEEWIALLKNALIKAPEHDGEHIHEYYSREDISISITAGGPQKNRYYSFGGPIWNALVDFSGEEKLRITYLCPAGKPAKVEWKKIKSITFTYIS